jgi:uncharacterized phiE125 gp8 family phage protein
MKTLAVDVSPVTTSPLSLDVVKIDLRIAHNDLDEAILVQYMPAAIEQVEAAMRRNVVARQVRWIIDEFPEWEMRLPMGKCTAVASIVYSVNGAPVTMSGPTSGSPGTDYQEDLSSENGGRLMPPRAGAWPYADCDVPAPIVVTFTAGWAAASIPSDIKRAITVGIAQQLDLALPGLDTELISQLVSPYRL